MNPAEQLQLQLERQTWRTFNGMRVEVGRSKDSMSRWGLGVAFWTLTQNPDAAKNKQWHTY